MIFKKIKFWIKKSIPTRYLEFLGKKGILISSIPKDEKSIIIHFIFRHNCLLLIKLIDTLYIYLYVLL